MKSEVARSFSPPLFFFLFFSFPRQEESHRLQNRNSIDKEVTPRLIGCRKVGISRYRGGEYRDSICYRLWRATIFFFHPSFIQELLVLLVPRKKVFMGRNSGTPTLPILLLLAAIMKASGRLFGCIYTGATWNSWSLFSLKVGESFWFLYRYLRVIELKGNCNISSFFLMKNQIFVEIFFNEKYYICTYKLYIFSSKNFRIYIYIYFLIKF